MTNDQYRDLWDTNDAVTFVVIDTTLDREVGHIVAETREQAYALFANALAHHDYPAGSVMFGVDDDFSSI